jgi:hypothetical protein
LLIENQTSAPVIEAIERLERYRKIWEGNFQRLDALLDELKAQQKYGWPAKG